MSQEYLTSLAIIIAYVGGDATLYFLWIYLNDMNQLRSHRLICLYIQKPEQTCFCHLNIGATCHQQNILDFPLNYIAQIRTNPISKRNHQIHSSAPSTPYKCVFNNIQNHKLYDQIQRVVLFDLNDGKVIENTFLSSYILFIPSNCLFL